MQRNKFIISNDKFYFQKKKIYSQNKNTNTILESVANKKVFIVSRKTKKKLPFLLPTKENRNYLFLSFLSFLRKLFEKKKSIFFFISVTPYNFIILIIILCFKKKNDELILFLRSDGIKEYNIKFKALGYILYYPILIFFLNTCKVYSCSKYISGIKKFKILLPSEIDNDWIKNNKINFINKKTKIINLLYLGRFRVEKGYKSLLKIFSILSDKKSKFKYKLTMVGNDDNFIANQYKKSFKNIDVKKQISNQRELIKLYDRSHFFILPSYTECYPQVILESFSRLRPVIVFPEIKHLKSNYENGVFIAKRNASSLEAMIIKLSKNYSKISSNLKKNKIMNKKKYQQKIKNILD